MTAVIIIAILAAIWLAVAWQDGYWPFVSRRRTLLKARPFPPEWDHILNKNVALYHYLPAPLKKQLQGHIQVFLAEKTFEGCGGLDITDEIRVTIAGQACILLLNRKTDYYPRLYSILVYPTAYVAQWKSRFGFFHEEEHPARLGESWTRGAVVVAWDHAKQTTVDFTDGHNVVLHEFAHQLDQEDGVADGVPILDNASNYGTWARVLGTEYQKLQESVLTNKRHVMDDYGETNPAEFFAVATETFFEKPHEMKARHPELYTELMEFYRVNPEEWFK